MPQTPLLTVDAVIFNDDNAVLLIRRRNPPFQGHFALPGGYVEIGETVEDACRRETQEETGLAVADLKLVGVYSDPHRDPRRHTVSIAFQVITTNHLFNAGSDAASCEFVDDWQTAEIAFDHKKIIADAEAIRKTLR